MRKNLRKTVRPGRRKAGAKKNDGSKAKTYNKQKFRRKGVIPNYALQKAGTDFWQCVEVYLRVDDEPQSGYAERVFGGNRQWYHNTKSLSRQPKAVDLIAIHEAGMTWERIGSLLERCYAVD